MGGGGIEAGSGALAGQASSAGATASLVVVPCRRTAVATLS
jgi:hypothetical protein